MTPLVLTLNHPANNYNLGVVLLNGDMLDGEIFRRFRDTGYTIETPFPFKMARAMGIPVYFDPDFKCERPAEPGFKCTSRSIDAASHFNVWEKLPPF